jgi:hypothetical protein
MLHVRKVLHSIEAFFSPFKQILGCYTPDLATTASFLILSNSSVTIYQSFCDSLYSRTPTFDFPTYEFRPYDPIKLTLDLRSNFRTDDSKLEFDEVLEMSDFDTILI